MSALGQTDDIARVVAMGKVVASILEERCLQADQMFRFTGVSSPIPMDANGVAELVFLLRRYSTTIELQADVIRKMDAVLDSQARAIEAGMVATVAVGGASLGGLVRYWLRRRARDGRP